MIDVLLVFAYCFSPVCRPITKHPEKRKLADGCVSLLQSNNQSFMNNSWVKEQSFSCPASRVYLFEC